MLRNTRGGPHVAELQAALQDIDTVQYRARHGHPAMAEAFLTARMGGNWGGAFGTLPTGLDLAPIVERAMVKG